MSSSHKGPSSQASPTSEKTTDDKAKHPAEKKSDVEEYQRLSKGELPEGYSEMSGYFWQYNTNDLYNWKIHLSIDRDQLPEAFNLIVNTLKSFFEISSNASGQCWSMTSYCPAPGIVETAPSNNNYAPGFMGKMMLKDLRLAQHAAESVNVNIPLGAEAAELYAMFVQQGFGEKDFSGIIEWLGGNK